MGILARKQGEAFVITSDRILGEAPTHKPPKKPTPELGQIWTGDQWSATMTEAKTFPTLDTADDYVRANFGQMMK